MAELNLLAFSRQLRDAVEKLMNAVDDIQRNGKNQEAWEQFRFAQGKLEALHWVFLSLGEIQSFDGKAVKKILSLLVEETKYVGEDILPTASIAFVFVKHVIKELTEEEE